MPPHVSTVGITPPPSKTFHNDVDSWLDDKRAIDGAEGFWRIHDELYDLSDFITTHPGGQFWLEETRGTDITEAFESHHLSALPEDMIKNYHVRKAKSPRASPYTFKEDGFYRTLKRKARKVLKTLPKDSAKLSDKYSDALIAAMFVTAIVAVRCWSFGLAVISGALVTFTATAAHNYSHQRDNFRMYYGDICMENSRSWRISHVLSHHLFTNTIADLQAIVMEPFSVTYPQKKSFIVKYGSWVYLPLIIWPTRHFIDTFIKIHKLLFFWKAKRLEVRDVLPFLMPTVMHIFSGQSLLSTLLMWQFIIAVGGFCFDFVGFTNNHYHPEVFMDGDTGRSEEDKDWGVNQLDCVADRKEVLGNHFLVLVTFGDHALHHLFPTLDHGLLQHLYPLVLDTMKQFGLDLKINGQANMFAGYFKQLAREKPNPNRPGLKAFANGY